MQIEHWMVAVLLALVSLPPAQFTLAGGIEYFNWTENTQPIEVKEGGLLGVFTIGYTQVKQGGWLFACRGEFYLDEVNYCRKAASSSRRPMCTTSA